MELSYKDISIVLPARNEAESLKHLLPEIKCKYPEAEIIVVNDASEDNTNSVCQDNNVICIEHLYTKGNGAAVKTGARNATRDFVIFMDADGQHRPEDIAVLTEKLAQGYDLVVGARSFKHQANFARGIANIFYNWFSSLITGQKIKDLTSGFRAVRLERFKEFINILPNGFSYPTTTTITFLRVGYSVGFADIEVLRREGDSHIRLVKDGIKFLLIIFRVGVLYSPLKIFFPVSLFFFTSGIGYYAYTFLSQGRFTNMGMLLLVSSIIVFLIGLISEQITFLLYSQKNK